MNLELEISKKSHNPECYLEVLAKYPEGKWFAPSNQNGSNDFTYCDNLVDFGLIARMTIPQWHNGHVGTKHYFLYRHDLNFTETERT